MPRSFYLSLAVSDSLACALKRSPSIGDIHYTNSSSQVSHILTRLVYIRLTCTCLLRDSALVIESSDNKFLYVNTVCGSLVCIRNV